MKKLQFFFKFRLNEWIWPLLVCSIGWRFIAIHLNAPILIDPQNTYLPAAKAFLDQGWSFFMMPESHHVTPLAYLWPALWGMDPVWIRFANMGLWGGCVWFSWRTGCLLGGHRAGIVAMLLLLNPEFFRYFPSEMTEPIYLFSIFGWIYAMALIVISQSSSRALIAFGAAMLTASLLSRPVLQFMAPAVLLACWIFLVFKPVLNQDKNQTSVIVWHQIVSKIAWSIGLGLILPLVLLVKNGIIFGLWGLSTGSGIGLYLGTHPLFQGAEPIFLGFDFDVNTLASMAKQPGAPHSQAGDIASRQAALWQVQSMRIAEATDFFTRKLWWWLAHHPAEIERYGSALRKIRLFELTTLTACILWLAMQWRKSAIVKTSDDLTKNKNLQNIKHPQWLFAAFLLVFFLGMLIQLLPILYNSRYSSALLDPWLVPLTAFSVAYLSSNIQFHSRFGKNCLSFKINSCYEHSIWPTFAVFLSIIATFLLIFNFAKRIEFVSVDYKNMGQTKTHFKTSSGEKTNTSGMKLLGERTWEVTEFPAVIKIQLDEYDVQKISEANIFNALWNTELLIERNEKKCKKAEFSYQIETGEILQPHHKQMYILPLKKNGSFVNYPIHANFELRPKVPGNLRIVFYCPVGTIVKWRGTQLLESRHAWEAALHTSH